MPVGLGVVLVAVVLSCVGFVGEDLLLGDEAIQTLRREKRAAAVWCNWSDRHETSDTDSDESLC